MSCSNLASLTIPNSVTSIGNYAFWGCRGLTSVTIPNSVTRIGDYAFLVSGLTSITIPKGAKIGSYAFASCDDLTSVTMPGAVTFDGEFAFGIENNITSVFITDLSEWLVTSFQRGNNPLRNGAKLFLNNVEVKDLVIPDGTARILTAAFEGCVSITSVTIPGSVFSYEDWAFAGCPNLTDVWCYNYCQPTGDNFFSNTDISSATLHVPLNHFPYYRSTAPWMDFGKIVMIEETPIIAFADPAVKAICVDNWDITGDGELNEAEATLVTDLGSVFSASNITSFDELQYFAWLTDINEAAFSGCSSLTSITIPEGVTDIGSSAFEGCSSLTSINIPNGVMSIGSQAFSGCSSLTSVYITDLEAWCNISFEDNPLAWAHHLYLNDQEIKDLVIPEDITSIGDKTFSGCSGLTSINIHDGVTHIGAYAFENCSSLASIDIPSRVTSIGDEAFSGCYFTEESFINNSSLTDDDNWGATLCDEETNDGLLIKNNAIVKCRPWATSVTIPEGVTSIASSAFFECNLTDVFCEAEQIPETNGNPFDNNTFTSATLHVPAASLEAYSTTEPWSNFSTIAAIGDNRISQALSFESLPIMIYGDDAYTLPATTDEELTLTWTINDAAIATISGNELTINGAGTTTIVANQAGNDTYLPIHRSYTLTVQKAMLTITAIDCFKIQGAENPELTVIYSGFKYNDDASVLTTQPTVTTSAQTNSPIGTYPINVSGAAEADNYYFYYVNGTLTVIDETTNGIRCKYITARSGEEVELPIQLTKDPNLDIVGIEFTLTLPEGVSFKKDVNNNPVYVLNDSRLDPEEFGVTQIMHSDNSIGVRIYSIGNSTATLQGTEGTFMTFTLNIAENMEAGYYNIRLTGNKFSIKNSVNSVSTVSVSDASSILSITGDGNGGSGGGQGDVNMGDVNDDGQVDLSDAIMVIYYTLHVIPDNFVTDAADLNNDGEVDLSDAITIIYMSLGVQVSSNAKRPSKAAAKHNDWLQLSGESNRYSMSLSNEGRYLGFQCDVKLPEGTTLSSVALSDSRAEGHSLMYRQLEDGSYRIAVFSANGEVFSGNVGELLTFTTEGPAQEEVCVKNIFFVNTYLEKCVFDDLSVIATGIQSTFADDGNAPVYDLFGRKIANSKSTKGIYISKNKKTLRK